MFKKVLIAVDFSGPAMELFNAIGDLKKMGLEELVIVHVVRIETTGLGIGAHRKRFLAKVNAKCEELRKEGFQVKVLQPVGSPAEEIRRISEEENVDLILIGSIGEGSMVRELFLGSTVNNVVRLATKPVLVEKFDKIGKNPVRKVIFPEGGAPKILLATDFSRSSAKLFDFFCQKTDIFKNIVLFHAVDEGYTEEQLKNNRKKALGKLEKWTNEFRERGAEVEVVVSEGIASEEVLKAVKECGATLVGISRRGRGIINELLIGSTADPVVRRSSSPVLLLKG